jgi:hypothetical protein
MIKDRETYIVYKDQDCDEAMGEVSESSESKKSLSSDSDGSPIKPKKATDNFSAKPKTLKQLSQSSLARFLP